LSAAAIADVAATYRQLGPASESRHHLSRWLAADGSAAALAQFAELMAVDPPREARQADLAFVPLFQGSAPAVAALFPRLLDALAHPSIAAVVLDTANHAYRRGGMRPHPAADRADQLTALLGEVVSRLRSLEERPGQFGQSAEQVRLVVAEGTALVVGLCDALALMEHQPAVPKLTQALSLGHRRLRTEAAAALARLGQTAGIDALIELTAEPVVRNRAIAYLDEAGHGGRVPPERRSTQAQAEGELAAWLASPAQMGLPPQELTLVDSCRLHWPGFEAAVDCHLISFEYRFASGTLSGVGIVGPVTHVLPVDLEDLPPADIQAMYAGWHAEHEALTETDFDELPHEERVAFEPAAERLIEQGFTDVRPALLGRFFEDRTLVFQARHGDLPCIVLVEGDAAFRQPCGVNRRPLGPKEAYWLHKGRKLLRAFNPPTRS
jgi:HEAT repeat protein